MAPKKPAGKKSTRLKITVKKSGTKKAAERVGEARPTKAKKAASGKLKIIAVVKKGGDDGN